MTPTTVPMNAMAQDTMQKLTGNVSDELTEAGYRLAAVALVRGVRDAIINNNPAQEEFLETSKGEALLSFGLAVALEVIPTESLVEPRRCLASNLRIHAYEILGESLLQFAGLVNQHVEAVLVNKAADLAAMVKTAEEKKVAAQAEKKAAA